jgi:hypothetical protein
LDECIGRRIFILVFALPDQGAIIPAKPNGAAPQATFSQDMGGLGQINGPELEQEKNINI